MKKSLVKPCRGRSRYALVAVALLAALIIAGCGSSSSSSSSSESSSSESAEGGSSTTAAAKTAEGMKFAAMIADTTNPFEATMAKEMENVAAEKGIELEVFNGELNVSNQVAQIQQQIANGVDALLVLAADPAGIVPALTQANAAGIPVIAVNAAVEEGAEVVTFVGDDDYQYGVKEGELVAKALGGKGTVALDMGLVGTSPAELRTKGIEDELAKSPGIEIVTKVSDEWKNEKNLAVVQDLLTKYPKGQLGAIVAEGPQVYIGAKYAASKGRNDVKFIGGDYPKQMEAAIKEGSVYGTVGQDPQLEGKLAVEVAEKWLTGRQDEVKRPNEYIELPLITKENVDQYKSAWVW